MMTAQEAAARINTLRERARKLLTPPTQIEDCCVFESLAEATLCSQCGSPVDLIHASSDAYQEYKTSRIGPCCREA